uniref:Uncharacterized protein n=1 Tax=Anguilla anguilla TaxID=7936 RepID=A0A0E9PXI1_ANGAN
MSRGRLYWYKIILNYFILFIILLRVVSLL